jgi:hypothetical protein
MQLPFCGPYETLKKTNCRFASVEKMGNKRHTAIAKNVHMKTILQNSIFQRMRELHETIILRPLISIGWQLVGKLTIAG